MKKIIFLLLISHFCFSQNISGTIFDKQNNPIPGVYIYWENKINTTVISDTNGKFSINPIDNSSRLIFRALGFKNDTINPFEKRTSLFFMEEESSMLNEEIGRAHV